MSQKQFKRIRKFKETMEISYNIIREKLKDIKIQKQCNIDCLECQEFNECFKKILDKENL